jgi:site-specific recombinase XerC
VALRRTPKPAQSPRLWAPQNQLTARLRKWYASRLPCNRRTKASIIYKATDNLRAVQILLGHTKIENTVRYLGVDVENALTLAEGTEI